MWMDTISSHSSVFFSHQDTPPIFISHTNTHKTMCVCLFIITSLRKISSPTKTWTPVCLIHYLERAKYFYESFLESDTQQAFWPRIHEATSCLLLCRLPFWVRKVCPPNYPYSESSYITCKPYGWNERCHGYDQDDPKLWIEILT